MQTNGNFFVSKKDTGGKMLKSHVVILFLLFPFILLAEDRNNLPEKYVSEVIIEADWGDGEGEFGMDVLSSPPMGPGQFIIDRGGDLYINDFANKRLYRYDKKGKLIATIAKGELITGFTIRKGTIFALTFPFEKVILIDIYTGTILKRFEINLENKSSTVRITNNIENVKGEIVVASWDQVNARKEKYILGKGKHMSNLFPTRGDLIKGNFRKFNDMNGEFTVNIEGIEYRFKLSSERIPGRNKLVNASLIGRDEKGNFYLSVWVQNPIETNKVPVSKHVLKFSPESTLLSIIKIPLTERVGEHIGENPQISPEGDIYYLYPTGEFIEKDRKSDFIPGSIKVIKWELHK